MGLLRFFLSVAVVIVHVGPFFGVVLGSGRLAVQIFYMISVFYMALVWKEKYAKLDRPISTFYFSRSLRLYPMYLLVLIVILLLGMFNIYNSPAFNVLEVVNERGWLTFLWIYLTQIILIGIEGPLFKDFSLNSYMLLPVAWTLGVELTFYLLVPFLMPNTKVLILVMVASFVLRIICYLTVLSDDPLYQLLWSYRFFPFEIGMFLAGALAYKSYTRFQNPFLRFLKRPDIYFFVSFSSIGLLFYFWLVFSKFGEATYWIYYLIFIVLMILLFHNSRESKIDGYIGELSYPMYIAHLPVLWIIQHYCKSQNVLYLVMPATIIASMALVKFQNLFDQYRHSFVQTRLQFAHLP